MTQWSENSMNSLTVYLENAAYEPVPFLYFCIHPVAVSIFIINLICLPSPVPRLDVLREELGFVLFQLLVLSI